MTPTYPKCTRCHRPMRKARDLKADHPTTIRLHALGLCVVCYVARASASKPNRLCASCGVSVRPPGLTGTERPGTLPCGRVGMCRPCSRTQSAAARAVESVPQIDGGHRWSDRKACGPDDDVDLYPIGKNPDWRPARAICASCPVRDLNCGPDYLAREHGQARQSRFGFGGGMTPGERDRIDHAETVVRPISHGTAGGYHAHRRRGETACDACLVAARVRHAVNLARREQAS